MPLKNQVDHQAFYETITNISPWDPVVNCGPLGPDYRPMTDHERWLWRAENGMMHESECEYVELEDKWDAFWRIFGRKQKFKPHPLENRVSF